MTMSYMMTIFMKTLIMLTMIMTIASTLTMSIHPLMLILILVVHTILNLFYMYFMTSMSTYMYMIFISIIGGMMIMFLYFTSMINNYQSKIKMNELLMINFMMVIMLMMMIYIYMSSQSTYNPELCMSPSPIITIFKIYMYPLSLMTVTTIFNLLYCLILTIKMCSSKYTPLRKIKYEKI
uniref:NADH dehydrogenase subunit 6 n=1 Tax=Andrena camellia TaxID=1862692 RepID=A0A1W2SX92_9HYME|nr:NADH dehydrogenase subunit 6 [Andrena camellia]